MVTLTAIERDKLLRKLANRTMDLAIKDQGFLWGMVRDGFKGFDTYTDEALMEEHQESFGYNFLEV